MATTVNQAFNEFLANIVNLDSEETKSARRSRDWLVKQVHAFPGTDENFPRLYSEQDIFFGSFARRTKIRPLDDVDIMICLAAEGATYLEQSYDNIDIYVHNSSSNLNAFCNADTNILNSRKIVNTFVSAASKISHYSSADIKRMGEAATIKLTSYPWNFDVVPTFFTTPAHDGRIYYIIPDGQGRWKKTDPRLDRDRVTEVNRQHDGNMLNVLRVLKYWNARKTAPAMPSYLLETMVVDHFQKKFNAVSSYVDIEVGATLLSIANSVLVSVEDPKRIQGDLNGLDWDTRFKIKSRSINDSSKASEASDLEQSGDHHGSISKWREIFGDEFPKYG